MYQRSATKSYMQDSMEAAASADITRNSTTIIRGIPTPPGRLLCAISEKQRSYSASGYEPGKNLAKILDSMSQFSWEKKN